MRHQAPRQQLASRKRRQQKFTSPHPHQEIASSTYQASWTSAAVSAASHERASSNSSNLSWLGFVYAGELASSGFGANSAGIGFSLNAVFPAVPLMPGISRNFVLRHLLQARSIKEALAIIARPGQVRLVLWAVHHLPAHTAMKQNCNKLMCNSSAAPSCCRCKNACAALPVM